MGITGNGDGTLSVRVAVLWAVLAAVLTFTVPRVLDRAGEAEREVLELRFNDLQRQVNSNSAQMAANATALSSYVQQGAKERQDMLVALVKIEGTLEEVKRAVARLEKR